MLYFSSNNSRFASILIGFCIGFIQDLISEVELMGIYSFIKSLNGYLFGSLKKYDGFYLDNNISINQNSDFWIELNRTLKTHQQKIN